MHAKIRKSIIPGNAFCIPICFLSLLVAVWSPLQGQTSSVVIPSNISTGSLEKNLLFYATERYQVTRQGPVITLQTLFDGQFQPAQSDTAPTSAVPLEILIEGLPPQHTQQGAWIGWSSRVWLPTSFRIEGYNEYNSANQWVTVANVTDYSQNHYMVKMPSGGFSKLRFTFYGATGTDGRIQLSELFFIHPEAAHAYDGLLVKYHRSGNVGIGTTAPAERLSVNGNIRAKEVKVETANWPDYVFAADYDLMPLAALDAYIKAHGHLPGIPAASEAEADGVGLAEMNRKLLEKVEELTLHLIELKRNNDSMFERNERLEGRIQLLENKK